jgi:hypothetical protein
VPSHFVFRRLEEPRLSRTSPISCDSSMGTEGAYLHSAHAVLMRASRVTWRCALDLPAARVSTRVNSICGGIWFLDIVAANSDQGSGLDTISLRVMQRCIAFFHVEGADMMTGHVSSSRYLVDQSQPFPSHKYECGLACRRAGVCLIRCSLHTTSLRAAVGSPDIDSGG